MFEIFKQKTKKNILALGTSFVLSACTVGPNFEPDHMKLPENWKEHKATPEEIERTNKEMISWWSLFHDPLLDQLVKRAVEGNYNLQIAGQRILAAKAMRDRYTAEWYPQGEVVTSGGVDRFSTSLGNWPIAGYPSTYPFMAYGPNVTWQLDVFGRIRREVEAQEDVIGQNIEARRSVMVTILAELASDYMLLRSTQLQLKIADDNIRVAQDNVNLVSKLYQKGVGNTLQIAQANSELHAQLGAREPLKTRISQVTHAIDVLLGQMPGTSEDMLKIAGPMPVVPELPATLPTIVVANRPDIRQAERRYAEAMARIGVAVSNMYPNFTLPLSFQPQFSAFHQFFNASSFFWQFILSISTPIMQGGKLTAEVQSAQAEAEATRLAYRQTILTAFKEVEDAFAAWNDDEEREKFLRRSSEDSQLASDRAKKLYKAGLTGYLEVLTTQRTALSAQNAHVLSRLERLQDAVRLYSALGAGWRGIALTSTELPINTTEQNILAKAFTQ
ncbi:efflux transporter outer membrane subunit [Entomobacter blattae]|uniref:Outer membrane protein OprM n=1 Tax=Entomobacter blattae TaxID=2762277 RepID=A0A7H1NPI3_9PROT|nr:efflux transporter outer membrane subunit [Entomobacter blattae]QNT77693.1 Outer membrane protein OprM [Entomobacter blattae]